MTAPSNSTRAKAQAKNAASAASEAAQEATEATKTGIRAGFAAVRNSEEVRSFTSGTRKFLKAAENPALVAATIANPLVGLGATGIVKGSRLLAEGLREQGRTAPAEESTDSATA